MVNRIGDGRRPSLDPTPPALSTQPTALIDGRRVTSVPTRRADHAGHHAHPASPQGPNLRTEVPPATTDVPAIVSVLTGRGAARPLPEEICGEVVRGPDGPLTLRDLFSERTFPIADELPEGTVIKAEIPPGPPPRAKLSARLAEAGTPQRALYDIAARHGLNPVFPPAVRAEAAAWVKNPDIDDPTLVDLTHLPFVTIDNEHSKDLDQALYLTRNATTGGYTLYYALADAAHYVRPGSALFNEALQRASSYYLPGLTVPMLPKELSEGIISLNEGVDRRSMVFKIELDAQGQASSTDILRARVHSQKKLTYDGVQAYHDAINAGSAHALEGQAYSDSLRLLREVGELRMADQVERDVVRVQRTPVNVQVGGQQQTFHLVADTRNDVEKWNEQISLLTNIEGAMFLMGERGANLGAPNLQAVFRTHDSPPPERLRELSRFIGELVTEHGLDAAQWAWPRSPDHSLADYLAELPLDGPHAGVARAIHRRALVINVRSEFEARPGPHHGIGAAAYARFSAPMREMVGIFTHKEAYELLSGQAFTANTGNDEKIRLQVIEGANRAKQVQNAITKEANKLAIDALFEPDLAHPQGERPIRQGTILGASGDRLYVQLDDPPIEVKVYFGDLQRQSGKRFTTSASEVAVTDGNGKRWRVGDSVSIVVQAYDRKRNKWSFAIAPQ